MILTILTQLPDGTYNLEARDHRNHVNGVTNYKSYREAMVSVFKAMDAWRDANVEAGEM